MDTFLEGSFESIQIFLTALNIFKLLHKEIFRIFIITHKAKNSASHTEIQTWIH